MPSVLALLLTLNLATNLVPLNDLGKAPYDYGYFGGLYDDGSSTMPADHLADGLAEAAKIQPLDANGNPSASGKIVFLGAGFSETAKTMDALLPLIANDRRVDREALVIANGAQPGLAGNAWGWSKGDNYERVRTSVLLPAGVTEKQVQAVWLEIIDTQGFPPLPIQFSEAYNLKIDYSAALGALKLRYPNLRLAYLSSRVYGGYATRGTAEPRAYESGLTVRWMVEGQITLMRTGSLWDTRINNIDYRKGNGPWIAWGPYLWANGATPRSDGLTWLRDDFELDGESLSERGAQKAAHQLLEFLLHEPTAASWFLASPQPPSRARIARH